MRRLIAPVILVLLLAAVPAMAGRVGFVDAEQAVAEVEEGKAKLAELQAWQAPYHTRLDRLREQVLALDNQLEEKQGKVTEEAWNEMEKRRIAAMREFEDARREYERQLEAKKEEILGDIASKIGVIGAEYAKANDFDAVFLLKAQPMMYVAKSVNLTEKIVEIYNQRYPVSGN
jgi:outer membrane protein